MRNATSGITETQLMFVIGGELFELAPNRHPRKVEIIMEKVRDTFRKDAYNYNEFYSMQIEPDKLYGYLEKLLKDIPEFQELNLSQIEFDNNISVDDENRGKYRFITRYDKYDSESWKNEFIDLDAFIQNIHYKLTNNTENDCFACANQETIECSTCSVNPNFKNNYKSCRNPKGKYTFSCEYDCFKQNQICCEECDEFNLCQHKCDSKSEICGNIYKKPNLQE